MSKNFTTTFPPPTLPPSPWTINPYIGGSNNSVAAGGSVGYKINDSWSVGAGGFKGSGGAWGAGLGVNFSF